MASAVTAERGSKSTSIRAFLKKQPNASVQEIQDALKEQGIEASNALVSKLKYSGGTKTKRGRKAAATPAASKQETKEATGNGTTSTNKSQAIRDAFKKLGRRTRPSEIRASLAENGVIVSSAQISNVRTAMRNSRKQNAPVAATVAPTVAISTGGLSADDLLATKKLVDQLGGISAAQDAVRVLGQLTGA